MANSTWQIGILLFAAAALAGYAQLPPMPPGAKPVLKSPKDAAAGSATRMVSVPLIVTNQPPRAVIDWHFSPGQCDADPSLTNGVLCDIFSESDAVRLEFFSLSNRTNEVQVKAALWESIWRIVLRFDPDGFRADGLLKVRYPFGQAPADVPTRFFRVMSN
jgi:hypothetical protein